MSILNWLKRHEHSEIDEILYELMEANKNLLEVQTRPADPDLAPEWRKAVYRARIAQRVSMRHFKKKDWFADEDED